MILKISLILVALAIAYLSLTPVAAVTVGNDKISHFLAYSVLMTNLGLVALPSRKRLWFAVIAALCYGALMEAGQGFVPGRTLSFLDMLANATGVTIGVLITLFFGTRIKQLLAKARIK